jgi:predicted AlkP superfamily pyrophosphatase or phosphodiesterase
MSREPRRVHVFVLIDALGWDLAQRFGFLADVLPYRTPLRTVLGYSSGAIPTMLTGKTPAEHGHWNLLYYDPVGSPFRWLRALRFVPDRILSARVTRKALKELGRRVLGLGPLFDCAVPPRLLPYFNWIETRNIYAPRGIRGGPSIFDQLTTAGVPHRVYSYHRFRDAEILRRARREVETGPATLFFLYLSELDAFLHHHVEDAALLKETFARYEIALRELLGAARRRDAQAGFTLLSDHGMTPIRRHHDLARDIEGLGLRMLEDYLVVYDSTMARFWFFSPHARAAIVERLGSLSCGRILSEDERGELGIRFADRRYGDLVFLLDPGWLVSSSDFSTPAWRPAGMHGYHPDDPSSDAIFLSNQEPPVPMRTIADAYACMAHAAALHETNAEAPR